MQESMYLIKQSTGFESVHLNKRKNTSGMTAAALILRKRIEHSPYLVLNRW